MLEKLIVFSAFAGIPFTGSKVPLVTGGGALFGVGVVTFETPEGWLFPFVGAEPEMD